MALYLITRTDTDNIQWDEVDAVVVRAEDAANALALVTTRPGPPNFPRTYEGFMEDGANLLVTEVPSRGPAGVILVSNTGS